MNSPELSTVARPILALLILASTALAADPKIPWVQMDASGGKLAYRALPAGDRIMDFSHAGYMGGGVALPTVAVKMKVRPTGGDDTEAGVVPSPHQLLRG